MLEALYHEVDETRKEKGCIFYNLVKDYEIVEFPGFPAPVKHSLSIVESWESHEHLLAHSKTPHVQRVYELILKHGVKATPNSFQKVK